MCVWGGRGGYVVGNAFANTYVPDTGRSEGKDHEIWGIDTATFMMMMVILVLRTRCWLIAMHIN